MQYDMEQAEKSGSTFSIATAFPLLMGQCVGNIDKVMPAEAIIQEMVMDAIKSMRRGSKLIANL